MFNRPEEDATVDSRAYIPLILVSTGVNCGIFLWPVEHLATEIVHIGALKNCRVGNLLHGRILWVVVFIQRVVVFAVVAWDEYPALGVTQVVTRGVQQVGMEEERVACVHLYIAMRANL